ncbi:lipopolysaccharide biosynthesis protein [Williamsia deligens]|uniref:Lipopolysaccharide biosynthesis protein n=1 Tax=Williamsia deligens TaxID=321325 RepID=A0ABW3GA67_9NOCA|nr:hypothetical protein [Williamsia deligens]MCP2195740.1 Membrane protein involved in the export of O-antigen and teichoic acid [Williamsia deligens]
MSEEPLATTTASASASKSNLMTTAVAVLWLYGGRGVGMLWTVVLLSQLGVADYGKYGMAFALAAVIGPPLDNPYVVRSMRESEERFVTERVSRFLMGLTLVASGTAVVGVSYIAWFGLTVAGGEIAYKSYSSRFARDGKADRVWRLDSIRQVVSVGLACIYLFGTDHPTLLGASALYVAPYYVILVLAAIEARGHRPSLPGPPRLTAALVGEMLGTALYLQGDVLLLGFLTNSTTAGYYTLCWTVAAALAAVGQSFGMTYHEPLRLSGGRLSSGPPPRLTLIIGGASTAAVALFAVALLISPAPTELAVAMLIISLFTGMRTMISILQVILYAQRRDIMRLAANLGLVPVKLGAVAALAPIGAVGASIASVGADAILLGIYGWAIYRRPLR